MQNRSSYGKLGPVIFPISFGIVPEKLHPDRPLQFKATLDVKW